jgi:uncharacterized membrane protein YgcG
MRGRLLLALLALVGMLVAASIGYAAYLASRDSVGLPVKKLDPAPGSLTPARARAPRAETPPARATATRESATVADDRGGSAGATTDDRSGRGSGSGSGGSGSGSGGSGSGSGRGGGDD